MKVITFLACFVLIGGKLPAQAPGTPAVIRVLHDPPDTVRVTMFNHLASYYISRNPVLGQQYTDSAIKLARELHDDHGLAIIYSSGGLNNVARGKDRVALSLYRQSLELASGLRDIKLEARLLHQIGLAYFDLSDYPLALKYQNRSFKLCQQMKDTSGMAAALNSTGVIFLYLSDYPSALDNYLRALQLYGQLNSEKDVAAVLSNLGLIYYHLGDYDTSLIYYFRAVKIFKKSGELYGLQNAVANIGNTYDNAAKPRKALEYYNLALRINKKLRNNRGIASDLINKGIVYYGVANYAASLTCLRKALNLYRQLEDKYGTGVTYTYLAAVYTHAPAAILAAGGINPSRRYRHALALQRKGLALAHEIGDLYAESEALGNMSDIYQTKRDFAGALDAYKRQVALRDSIFSHERRLEISRMQMQYDFSTKEKVTRAKMDRTTALAAAEITRQRLIRNTVLLGASVLLLMAIVSFLLYIRKHQAEERQKDAELQAQMAETEMKALRAQMNPHFIFNSLNSISDYISKHDPVMADYYLAKFSKMMRLTLEYSEYREISLKEELKALELYMQLECIRMNNKFGYELRIDKDIDLENTMVPPLILQPFVENSIWHGIAKMPGTGKIIIEVKKENEMISCAVEDNGVGLRADDPVLDKNKKSLGIKLTRNRIAMMNRSRGMDPTVTLCDLAEGFRVELKLPLVLNF